MTFSALLALVIAAVFVQEYRGAPHAGTHSQWLDALPDFAFNSPIDDDIAILNASMSHSFRFIDLNTTDAELLFSVASNRQAHHAMRCGCLTSFLSRLFVFVE
jgi:hypothetical protein